MENIQNDRYKVFNTMQVLIIATLFLWVPVSCSKDDPDIIEDGPDVPSMITGSVKDENGNAYPNTLVKINKATEIYEITTDSLGEFKTSTKDTGIYVGTFVPPLSTQEVTPIPVRLNVEANQGATLDFVIQTQPVETHVNYGNVDVLNEIRDKDGNVPTNPDEPLYAANYFDEPIGFLTAITAPDGHHVTLAEWQTATGTLIVHCKGAASTVEIALEGMIPNGTYAIFLGFLNKTKKVGESLTNGVDFVYPANPPLGSRSGTDNVLIAGADGTIKVAIEHASCILTETVALVIPIVYHIHGYPYGSGVIPDVENAAHLLVYFQ